jgi:hypothetical protein
MISYIIPYNLNMHTISYEEVASGALNDPACRFGDAVRLATDMFADLHASGRIVGATIFGSAVQLAPDGQPDFDPLSDLDAIAIIHSCDDYRALRDLRRGSEAIRATTAVEMELGWLAVDEAKNGWHGMQLPMHDWLSTHTALYPNLTIGTTPTDLIAPRHDDLIAITESWLRSTKNNTQKAQLPADKQLTSALNIPHVATRKTLDALWYSGKLSTTITPIGSYTKEGVARAAFGVYEAHDPELWSLYCELGLIKQGYLGFLMNAVAKGLASKNSYDATISDMAADAVPKVVRFLGTLQTLFNTLATDTPQTERSEYQLRSSW